MAQQNRNINRNDQRNGGRDNRSNNPRPPEQEVRVTSPYNFVPLNKEVYFPPWGPLISHDIPFEDSLSGSFEVEIEAKSPIFIGSGKNEGADKTPQRFTHLKLENFKKRYFIPGSSFRNMLRSVVEILGFGKLNKVGDLVDRGYRDLHNENLYSLKNDVNNLKMGWLQKVNDIPYITFAGNLGSLRSGDNANTVKYNELIDDITYNGRTINPLEKTKSIAEKYNKHLPLNSYVKAISIGNSVASKVLVITNHIHRKNHEFLFKNPNLLRNTTKINVSPIFDTFEIANTKDKKPNEAWSFWKTLFENNKPVPVFYRTNDNEEILDFGLTVLYKMAYEGNAIKKAIKSFQNNSESTKPDLSEALFGHINEDKLKGRVFVGHAFSENAKEVEKPVSLILGSPKPTFYPFYMKQNIEENSTKLEYNEKLHQF